MNKTFAIFLLFLLTASAYSEKTVDHAVLLSASIDTLVAPYSITIKWNNLDTNASSYLIYRKEKNENNWTQLGSFEKTISEFKDTNVSRGVGYEYFVNKVTRDSSYYGYGYIYSGFDLTTSEDNGTVLVVVDDSTAEVLEFEVNRFLTDLRCDGYIVKKIISERADKEFYAPQIFRLKKIIDDEKKKSKVKAIVILGTVPVPYSGNTAWDGHKDHSGAWPTDLFYATSNDYWSDNEVYNINPAREVNKNVPHDGKFDESIIINSDIQIGRIDMHDIPMNPKGEIEMMRSYLNKNHTFKNGAMKLKERGLIDDGFGLYSNEAFASNAWMNFSALMGENNIDTIKFRWDLRTKDYLWSFGCNPGSFVSVHDVAYSDEVSLNPYNTVFALLFGSYNGDWDSENNLLRAMSASEPSALCVIWGGRPYWYFHHMALGEPIGYSAMLTQNNKGLYDGTGKGARRGAFVNLIGDPTLKMRYIKPPKNLRIISDSSINDNRKINIEWNSSDDDVLGYNVYVADSHYEPFRRLNNDIVNVHNYSFVTKNVDGLSIMVRALKKENVISGSYYNLSLGSIIHLGTMTGIYENQEFEGISISPNPATNEINIRLLEEIVTKVDYSVLTMDGYEITNGSLNGGQNDGIFTLNLESTGVKINSGIYLIKIFDGLNFYLGKVCIIK